LNAAQYLCQVFDDKASDVSFFAEYCQNEFCMFLGNKLHIAELSISVLHEMLSGENFAVTKCGILALPFGVSSSVSSRLRFRDVMLAAGDHVSTNG
jgi:hypothetical protein